MNESSTTTSSTIAYRITNALQPDGAEAADITILDGLITTPDAIEMVSADNITTIDATGCYLLPGLVDLYSRCREPGLTRKGNIASESAAALSAGFTQVLCAPDTVPAVDSVATVELIMHRSEQVTAGADIIPMAALTTGLRGEQLSELATLQSAGCPVASQADVPLENTTVLYSAMQYAQSFDMPLLLTARDAQLGANGCAHTSAIATQLGLPTIPVAAETVALARLIELCHETGCRLHISRVSAARSIHHIEDAKQAGLPITCDVGIHHLFYIDELLAGYDASFNSAVPFRSRDDRQALRDGLKSGVIDAICTDHSPHDIDARLAPFPATEPGLSAYDWFVPLLLQLPEVTGLNFTQVIDKLHDAPLKILGNPSSNPLAMNSQASFSLLDANAEFNTAKNYLSSGANSPLAHHDASSLGLSPLKGHIKLAFHNNVVTRFA